MAWKLGLWQSLDKGLWQMANRQSDQRGRVRVTTTNAVGRLHGRTPTLLTACVADCLCR